MPIRDSSSEEEEEEEEGAAATAKISKRKPTKKRAEYVDSEEENGGFLSDGYDANFYGDFEDRSRLSGMTEVEREAILYERAQSRQARQERRSLEQKIKEREGTGGVSKRPPSKEVDLKRKRLDELKAKRQRKLEGQQPNVSDVSDESEEGELEGLEDEEDFELEEEELLPKRSAIKKKKKTRKQRKEDSDEDYYTEGEKEVKKDKQQKKTSFEGKEEEEEEEALDLDMANKLRLTRDILAQWVYRDGFDDICQKCLLRINLGPGRTGQPTYRVVEVKKIVQHHRTYSIKPGTSTNLAVLVKFAKNERIFSFEFVSNSTFTQSELSFWKLECEKAAVRIPYTNVSARRKIDKLKAFYSEPLSDAVITSMLERRNELANAQNAPRNLLAEQTILQQQLKEALERNNPEDEEVSRIEAELSVITARRQLTESKDRIGAMEDLNRRNRQVNLETGRQAEISRIQAELPGQSLDGDAGRNKSKAPPTLDPFQRRKCKPTVIHMNEAEESESAKEEATQNPKQEALEESATTTSTTKSSTNLNLNLFDVHNFDLDLEI